jgi:ATP-dependent RNA helicase HelY
VIRTAGFTLDPFQRQAMAAIDEGRSVVVAAPTGSGKTVVAEHAVARARAAGAKAFYTTPIKALSNQKFHDLTVTYGRSEVGLLTGDNAIAGDAPTVVMTTEVLRNMLYARSPTLEGLRWVVLDEVHYLEDPYRGPVWEEVVIHLPRTVGLVCLSATVSNAEELAAWVRSVRGDTDLIVETRRPVPLHHEYVVGERGSPRVYVEPTLVRNRPNPDGDRFDPVRGQPRDRARLRGRPARRWVTPRRGEVVALLQERRLLPAIYFLFSRVGCDEAAQTLAASGLQLADPRRRSRIDEIIDAHVGTLSASDLEALGFDRWRDGLRQGIASHHAGLIPPFKEAVEACFVEGLVQVVFATETLALGINMPARSVVIERLTKFTGETHALLTPGQYTQLTGRAGRRGIDEVGYALVLWSPWVSFRQVAELAQSRSFELRSAFRPTYNMAANLVRRHDRDEADRLLRSSFGQFQASRAIAEAAARADEVRAEAAEMEQALVADLGLGSSWRELIEPAAGAVRADRYEIEQALRALRPGTVVRLGPQEVGVLLSVAQRGPFSRVAYVDDRGAKRTVHSTALDAPPEVLGTAPLPDVYAPNDPAFATAASRALRAFVADRPEVADELSGRRPRRARRHLVRRARKLQGLIDEASGLDAQVQEGADSLIGRFDRILGVLDRWGYVDGWQLTERGELLTGLYHESDLLLAEALARGLLDELGPADLAGVVSCVVYEHRGAEPPGEAWYPTRVLEARCAALTDLAVELNAIEEEQGVPLTRVPDPTFVPVAQAWAAGGGLDDVLADTELTGGDFVRLVRQLVDVLGQLGRGAPDPATAKAARVATEALRRGIVAASAQVDDGPDGEAG